MAKKISRGKLKKAVRLAIAIHAYDAMDGFTHKELEGISEEDLQFMAEEAKRIAQRLAGPYPMNLGGVQECIDYFVNSDS